MRRGEPAAPHHQPDLELAGDGPIAERLQDLRHDDGDDRGDETHVVTESRGLGGGGDHACGGGTARGESKRGTSCARDHWPRDEFGDEIVLKSEKSGVIILHSKTQKLIRTRIIDTRDYLLLPTHNVASFHSALHSMHLTSTLPSSACESFDPQVSFLRTSR